VTTAAQIAAAYPNAQTVAPALVELGRQIDADPAWIANVIQWESRWTPNARNRATDASGLLQWMPDTARRLGTTTAKIRSMTAAHQMRYIAAYFRPFAGRLRSPVDAYMAVFYPAAVGKGPGYRFPARVTAQNPGIRTAADYARKADAVARLQGADGPPSSWSGMLARLGLDRVGVSQAPPAGPPADNLPAASPGDSLSPSSAPWALVGAAGLLFLSGILIFRRLRSG
jgi:hypothetical protein